MLTVSFEPLKRMTLALTLVGGGLALLGGLGPAMNGHWARIILLGSGVVLTAGGFALWRILRRTQGDVLRLHRRMAMMARVAQNAGSPVLVIDDDARVVWCNHAFERETGYALADVRGQHPGRWLRSPDADPVTTERVREAMRHRTHIDIELMHRYRDGKDRWVRLILAPQSDDQEQSCGYVAVLVDIDLQVRTRDAYRQTLRDRDAMMRTLDEYVIVAETDAQGKFTRVNKRFEEISGYAEAELLGHGFERVRSGWHPPSFWQNMWGRINRGLHWRGEVCNKSKQGRLYWVQSLVTPLVGPGGLIEKFVVIQSDISEHRLARIELSKSQTMLARTSQLAGVGGWYALTGTSSLHMTPECREIIGADNLELHTLEDFWRVFDAGARLVVRQQLREFAEHRRNEISFVAPVNPATGSRARWVKMIASYSLVDADGGEHIQRRVIGAVQDYTSQVLAQQRIREEQRILHSAMDAIGEAFALFDPQHRLVHFNDEYAAWMPPNQPPLQGVRHEDLLRRLADQGLFLDARGRESEWIHEVLRAPRSGEPDRTRQMADGRWIRFVDRITPDGYRVVFRYDVTALQSALLRADAAALSKGQFLANMSHEIRTPINAITGMLQLLGDTGLDERQAEMVRKSRLAARSLLQVINDILDFSKIEAGMMQLHVSPFRLSDMQQELAVILEGARGQKPLDVTIVADVDLPAVVLGDPVRLKQVLINLAGNAIKFTERGRVTMRWHLVDRRDGCARIRFAVEDTGIGIAPGLQASIFDSFSQGEASTTRRFGGSGLGLTISQRLVACMGGQIGLVSEPGKGSVFSFEVALPEADEADLPSDTPGIHFETDRPPLEGIRVLLVEDNPLNQEVAMSLLSQQGASVTLAENGLVAVERLQADGQAFDAVLMDMQMPVLDGLGATERIRHELGLVSLPVIAMTANAMTSDRDSCLQAGMNAHIGKPFDIAEVVRVLRHFTLGSLEDAVDVVQVAERVVQDEPEVLEDTAALRRLGGDRDLLAQLRARFGPAAQTLLQQVDVRVARAEWSSAADALHQLKGSAGVIGADLLRSSCGDVEHAFRTKPMVLTLTQAVARLEGVRAQVDDVERRIEELAIAGGHVVPVATGPLVGGAHPPVDESALHACVEALGFLKELCAASDMEAIEAHACWLAAHPAASTDTRFSRLNRCVEDMDLSAAAVECEVLLASLSPMDVPIE